MVVLEQARAEVSEARVMTALWRKPPGEKALVAVVLAFKVTPAKRRMALTVETRAPLVAVKVLAEVAEVSVQITTAPALHVVLEVAEEGLVIKVAVLAEVVVVLEKSLTMTVIKMELKVEDLVAKVVVDLVVVEVVLVAVVVAALAKVVVLEEVVVSQVVMTVKMVVVEVAALVVAVDVESVTRKVTLQGSAPRKVVVAVEVHVIFVTRKVTLQGSALKRVVVEVAVVLVTSVVKRVILLESAQKLLRLMKVSGF